MSQDILPIQLLVDEGLPPVAIPAVEPELIDDPKLSPEFLKPVLPSVVRDSLSEMSIPEPAKSLYRFGIVVEEFSADIVNEVMRDLIALLGSIAPTSRLVIVSPNSSPTWEKISTTLPIDVQYGGFDRVSVWKVYWKTEKPRPPAGVSFSFEKRIGNPGVKKIILRPSLDTAPNPVNPDANRMLPLGQSPSFRRQPSMVGPVHMTPQLYLWSSKIPLLTDDQNDRDD